LKTLLLIRHAKAASYGAEPGDHGRPLATKGTDQARKLASQLQAANVFVDLALVSTALRTAQTWQWLFQGKAGNEAQFIEELYLASAEQIERQIELNKKSFQTLAVIGHNPGLSVLAWKLLAAGVDHDPVAERAVRAAFKTAFAARFDFLGDKPKLVQLFDPRVG